MSNSLITIIESQQANNDNNENDETESDEEILLPPKLEAHKQTLIGRVRTCSNVTMLEWSFIMISAITIGVGFGLTVYRLLTIPATSDQSVFAILVLANITFATYYLFHGIFQEQPFEILMLILTTVLMWILVTINYAADESEVDEFKLIRFAISTALSIPNVILASIVGWGYWTSGNLVFKTVGGEIKFQKMCRVLFFGYSLLVFDAQAAISCIILVLESGLAGMTQEEIIIVFAGALFVGLWLTIGFFSMRTENLRLTWLFVITSVVQPLYVVYLFVTAIEQIHGNYSIRTLSAFVAGAALVTAHFILIATIPSISHNYGNGLKAKIYGDDINATRPQLSGSPRATTRNGEDIEPLIVPLQGSSRSLIRSDEDMEPLIIPGTSRKNYKSTITTEAIVTCP